MNNRRDFLKKSIIFGAFSIFAPTFSHGIWKPTKKLSNIDLIKAMGGVGEEALACQKAFAAYIGPVIKNVLNSPSMASRIYEDFYNWGDDDSGLCIPMDLDLNGGANREGCIIL